MTRLRGGAVVTSAEAARVLAASAASDRLMTGVWHHLGPAALIVGSCPSVMGAGQNYGEEVGIATDPRATGDPGRGCDRDDPFMLLPRSVDNFG